MLNLKIIFIVGCLIVVASAAVNRAGKEEQLKGAKREEAIQLLHDVLSKLAAGNGPLYTAQTVYSVTRQVVAGSLYKYKVDLTNKDNVTKTCNVSIWSKPWLPNSDQITINCPEEPEVKETV